MEKLVVKANAKINLTLDVIDKREDGYHLLDMVMHSVGIYDEITIKKNYENNIKVSCDNNSLEIDEMNSAFKAAKLVMEEKEFSGVDIHINKTIPIGAGMAGGSADAAAVIVGINELFNLNMSLEEMKSIALKIGADVPFCIEGGCVRATGIGEKMEKLSIMDLNLLIIKPDESISTAFVYKNLILSELENRPDNNGFIKAMNYKNLDEMVKTMGNVLEGVTASKVSLINEIKKDMINGKAKISMMTGSGTAVFGIFESISELKDCYESLRFKYNEIFVTKTERGGVYIESRD